MLLVCSKAPYYIDPPITDVVNDAEGNIQYRFLLGIVHEDNQNEEILQQLVAKYNAQSDTVKVNLEMKSDRYFYKIFSTQLRLRTILTLACFCSQAQYWDKGFLFSLILPSVRSQRRSSISRGCLSD